MSVPFSLSWGEKGRAWRESVGVWRRCRGKGDLHPGAVLMLPWLAMPWKKWKSMDTSQTGERERELWICMLSLWEDRESLWAGNWKGGLCGSVLQAGEHDAAGFPWRGWCLLESTGRAGKGQIRGTQMGNLPRTDGRKIYVAHERCHLAFHSQMILWLASYVCSGSSSTEGCVGGGSLGICTRLGLISLQRAQIVWWSGPDITQGLLVESAWSWRPARSKLCSELPLLFLQHSQYWEYSVEVLKLSITRSFTCESL